MADPHPFKTGSIFKIYLSLLIMANTTNKRKSRPESKTARNRHAGAEKRKAELSPKRKRQYKHILKSEREKGRSEKTSKRIAMATVNKTRKEKGEVKDL